MNNIILDILVIILLILLNGFFALSEIALVSSKKIRLESLKNEKKRGASYALKLRENSENFLSAIQVGITLIGIVTGYYSGSKLAVYVAPLFERISFLQPYANEIAVVLVIILITFISIVIGELVPKTLALSNPEKIAVVVAPVIYYFSKIFYPVVKTLSASTHFINKILGIKNPTEKMTEEEIRHMIRTASQEGVIEQEQNLIHEKLFYFSDKRAKHIMTHRSEVEWIDINLPDDEFSDKLLHVKNSKILVCDKYIEEFLGVLNVKEFLIKKLLNEPFDLEELLDIPIIVPENTEAQDILDEFRKKQTYFCVVLNEFGTLEGIVTLHDIIENIIGELPEEEEIVEPDIFVREDKSVLVSGDAPIEVLLEVIPGMDIDFEEIDYATVAGFVLEHIEKMPEIGDKFDFMGYLVEILDVDHNRIDKVLFKKIEETTEVSEL